LLEPKSLLALLRIFATSFPGGAGHGVAHLGASADGVFTS